MFLRVGGRRVTDVRRQHSAPQCGEEHNHADAETIDEPSSRVHITVDPRRCERPDAQQAVDPACPRSHFRFTQPGYRGFRVTVSCTELDPALASARGIPDWWP